MHAISHSTAKPWTHWTADTSFVHCSRLILPCARYVLLLVRGARFTIMCSTTSASVLRFCAQTHNTAPPPPHTHKHTRLPQLLHLMMAKLHLSSHKLDDGDGEYKIAGHFDQGISCKQLAKTFRSKHPAIEYLSTIIVYCSLIKRKFSLSVRHNYEPLQQQLSFDNRSEATRFALGRHRAVPAVCSTYLHICIAFCIFQELQEYFSTLARPAPLGASSMVVLGLQG